MRHVSTVSEFLRLMRRGDSDIEGLWVEEYESKYPDVFDSYYDGFSDESRRATLARAPTALVDAVEAAEDRANAVVLDIETRLRAGGLVDDDLDVVLLVGNRTSNAWVSDLHGVPTLFMALELFPDPPYDAVAVAHEAVHVAHVRRGGQGWPEDVGAVLFQEGLATAASRVFQPGLSDAEYCWVDSDHDDWMTESEASLSDVVDRTAQHLGESCDAALGTALFAGDANHETWPRRVGYRLGDLLVRDCLDSYDLQALLDWSHARALTELRSRLPTLLAT